jgi:hypothetical protein
MPKKKLAKRQKRSVLLKHVRDRQKRKNRSQSKARVSTRKTSKTKIKNQSKAGRVKAGSGKKLGRGVAKRKIKKPAARSKPHKVSRTKKTAYQINRGFSLYKELHSLLAKAVPEAFPSIERELKKMGRIKLAILTGVFLNTDSTRVDMLVVGEGIQLSKFTEFIKELEAELGREIRYVILSKDEFIYRHEMFDRFLGDILEYPHQKIINRLKI